MVSLRVLLLLFLIWNFNAFADVTLPIRVQTEDAGTVVDGVWQIKVTDGTLADNTGGSVSIDISGTGDADQNLWATFNGDSGTTTANSTTDTLTVSGGGTVSTGISGDTLTITGAAGSAAAGGSDTHIQFNDATAISGDPGFSFNKTTDSIYVAGNAHIVGGIAHVVGSMGATLSVDTPAIENSFGGPVTFRDKANAYGYDVKTIVITVTDFTDEGIQAAIDALPVTGGLIQLLPGTYVCDATITIDATVIDDITIQGAGMSTIISFTQTNDTDGFNITGADAGWGLTPFDLYMFTLRDFWIKGNALMDDGMVLSRIADIAVENVKISSCGGYGINSYKVAQSLFKYVVLRENTTAGLRADTWHDTMMVACVFEENTGDGIELAGCFEVIIVGCGFEDNGADGMEIEDGTNTTPYTIVGSTFEGNAIHGMEITDQNFVVITGNIFDTSIGGDGIQITGGHKHTISGNQFTDNTYAIDLVGSSENKITGNTFALQDTSDIIQEDANSYHNVIQQELVGDTVIAFGDPILIEDCEDAWTAKADVTSSLQTTTLVMAGNGSSRNIIATAFGSGLIATEDFSAIDLSSDTKVGFWIRANGAVAANVLELVLDDDAACASPLETLSIPALTINRWHYVELDFVDPSALTAVISVGLNANSDPGALTVYIDDITTEYPKVWYDTSAATLEIENSNLDVSDRLVSAHIVANIGFETGVNIKLEPKHLRFNIWDPNAMYDDDETVCIWPQTDAAITVSKIELTLDADPTTELNTDLMFADVFIAHPSATVIDNLLTTSGTTSISSGFDDPTVPASKAVFIRFQGDPDSAITQANYDITFSYD